MFKKNDSVKIKNSDLYGTVFSCNSLKSTVIVSNKKITIKNCNLEYCSINDIKEKYTNTVNVSSNLDRMYSEPNFESEIMLRHQTLDEALYNLDLFIDSAILNNVSRIKIIHGKSGGVLRNGVHVFLQSDNRIESFRLGNYYEGSIGVTIAQIKV